MNRGRQRVFPARLASLTGTAAFVESFCASQGVAHGDALRLTLVIEELFTNTVMHGHRGDCDAPVRLRLRLAELHVVLHYADRAPPFDPLQHGRAATPEPEVDPMQRAPGGLGLKLVTQLAANIGYRRVADENRLRVMLLRQA